MKKKLHFNKKAIQFIILCICFFTSQHVLAETDLDHFVTTWNTNTSGSLNNSSIEIPTFGGGYSYDIDWDNDSVFDTLGVTGSIEHDFGAPGIYTIRIRGSFPRIYFYFTDNAEKLIDVNQWGSNQWTSMEYAFTDCENMVVSATDAPDLSLVTSMSGCFKGCYYLNGDFSNWDVSSVTNMYELFKDADNISGQIGSWDVSNVTNMSFMFGETNFNDNISSWDVSSVTNMRGMFRGTNSFNADISGWDVSSVTNMSWMFANANLFNRSIGNWDVSNVTDMSNMFYGADSFNKPIGNWDVSSVTNMSKMFYDTYVFNQDLSGWDVSNVTNMSGMFQDSDSFDQDIGDWDVSIVTTMQDMFQGATLSTVNYDSLLIGWSSQVVQNGVIFHGGDSRFCLGGSAREILISTYGWTISDENYDFNCSPESHFVMTYKTNNDGPLDDYTILIPTTGGGYLFSVDWGDGTFDYDLTGGLTHTYAAIGSYEVRIVGDFPRLYFNNNGNGQKLLEVNQWGDIMWTSMESAFEGCENMVVSATDAPDLSLVTSMDGCFRGCYYLNGDFSNWDVSNVTNMYELFKDADNFSGQIGSWDVSNVTNMSFMFGETNFNDNISNWDVSSVTNMRGMFRGTNSFNADISGWDVSNVTNMAWMFANANSFNRSIGNWDVSNVTDMSNMFYGADSFNKPIDDWDVSSVTNMSKMFYDTYVFDQDLSGWDVSNVTNMSGMFQDNNAFDQDIGDWNISQVTNMQDMFNGVTLSIVNYDSLLIGWSDQVVQNGVIFHGGDSQFCLGDSARQELINTYGWTVFDDGPEPLCTPEIHFVMTFKTNNPGSLDDYTILIPTIGGGYLFSVDWGDGTIDYDLTGGLTHTYAAIGTYEVRIVGDFPRLYFNNNGNGKKLLEVNQWGDIKWTSMESAFEGCGNMIMTATDAPDLSLVTSMEECFAKCDLLEGDFNAWDVSQVTNMQNLFWQSDHFNGEIGSWDVSSVTDMGWMFDHTDFNGDISNWDVSSVTDMTAMFSRTTAFNADISGWDVSNVTNMIFMFSYADAFDQNIGSWDIGNVTNMTHMFINSSLSTPVYDSILIGWSTQSAEYFIEFHGGDSQYCNGDSARYNLINSFGWTITDGGYSGCDSTHFVTTWKTDNPGSSNNSSIQIPTSGGGYNYDIDWNNDGLFDQTGITGSVIHDYNVPGTYTIRLRGDYPGTHFSESNGGDREKLISVDHWGSIQWSTMNNAFSGCDSLRINATDTPDLSGVTDASGIFRLCSFMNDSLDHWDVSTITNMNKMFEGCTNFNQSLNSWDVSNVTDMTGMFYNASEFNQSLDSWNTINVIDMTSMFEGAISYNGPLNPWNVSSVTSMSHMFDKAENFNQPLHSWDISQVSSLDSMFWMATSFDQNIGDWDVSGVTSMDSMFFGATLSTPNYDSLLIGWSGQTVQSGIVFHAGNSQYCQSLTERLILTDDFSWIISDDGYDFDCAPEEQFVMVFKTDVPGSLDDYTIHIPTTGSGYAYSVDWGDGTFNHLVSGSMTHTYAEIDTYEVGIAGIFPRIYFDLDFNSGKLLEVSQWGTNEWVSMEKAFKGCTNLSITAADSPDLSLVTNMSEGFSKCFYLNGNFNDWDVGAVTDMSRTFYQSSEFQGQIGGWNVSNVTTMEEMFRDTDFNQDISSWDVGSVTNMERMFFGTILFNQDISSWDVSSVTNMEGMFSNTYQFDKDISNWDVSSVANMNNMFTSALVFNQDIRSWDVSSVTTMHSMFSYCDLFDQNLGDWDISNVTTMQNMFLETTLSTSNYDSLLIGWSEELVQNDVEFSGGNSTYCLGIGARDDLVNNYNWTITDNGYTGCEAGQFITKWRTDNHGTSNSSSITIPTTGGGYDYEIDWDNDGVFDTTGVTGSITHDFGAEGDYIIRIQGSFPRIFFNGTGDKEKLLSVLQWGVVQWSSMNKAFSGCENLRIVATDAPDLSGVTDASDMFRRCFALNDSLNHWDVSTITDMNNMFYRCEFFNQPLNNWDVSNVTNMNEMFSGCFAFNKSLNSWDVGSVTTMVSMFNDAIGFNQPLNNWDVSNVTIFTSMFSGAPGFNQSLSNWDVSSATDMSYMFEDAYNFDQPLAGWNVSNVENMEQMFSHAFDFDQPLDTWDVSSVTNMLGMFSFATSFNQPLNNWDVSSVTNMNDMFASAYAFNQPLNNWDLSSALTLNFMFWAATDFDQNLGSWDISNVTSMENMFLNTSLSIAIYDSLLIGWGSQTVQNGVPFHGGNSQYCDGAFGRGSLMSDYAWIISDDGYTGCDTTHFVTTWKTDNPGSSNDNSITIPNHGGGYNYDVDWNNDGHFEQTGITGSVTHDYGVPGTYTIRLRGDYPRTYFTGSSGGDKEKLLSIDQWGAIAWEGMDYAFAGCKNLTISATDAPDLSNVTTTVAMFSQCALMNSPIGHWDVSNVTAMTNMFLQCSSFNQPLNDWDVSNVTVMVWMFSNATAFDQPLHDWDVSNVTAAINMFLNVELSFENYDSLLIGWSQLPLQSGVSFHAGSSEYCAGAEARQLMIDDFGWTITDGGNRCETFWTGSINSNWFDPGNWSEGVPDGDYRAIIPDVAPNPYPVVDQAGAVCGQLEAQPGTSVTIATGGELTIGNQ